MNDNIPECYRIYHLDDDYDFDEAEKAFDHWYDTMEAEATGN